MPVVHILPAHPELVEGLERANAPYAEPNQSQGAQDLDYFWASWQILHRSGVP